MRLALPKAASLLLSLWVWSLPANAQPTKLCASCLASAHCEDADPACVPACEARYFTIDPRRTECLAQCSAALNQCRSTAAAGCRQQKACR